MVLVCSTWGKKFGSDEKYLGEEHIQTKHKGAGHLMYFETEEETKAAARTEARSLWTRAGKAYGRLTASPEEKKLCPLQLTNLAGLMAKQPLKPVLLQNM